MPPRGRPPVVDLSDEDMLAELGASFEAKPERAHTAREERVLAGFEDILKFYDTHGRAPLHGEEQDIFERLYAVRLDRLRALPEFHPLLTPLDVHGLLGDAFAEPPSAAIGEGAEDEALLEELGALPPTEDAITNLRHVRSQEERRAAEEIANRTPCVDFDQFKPLFEQVKRDIADGARQTRQFGENAQIKQGEFFILGGQMAYVAEVPEELTTEHGHAQGRLRVIYDNGTEGDPLLRSFQRALYKDDSGRGRRITEPDAGPLFADRAAADDTQSGTIYVLQSLSDHPEIASRRELIHKIGVTGGDVETRIADAANQPTYLLAGVKVVATYKLYNVNRTRLEHLLHDLFAPARLDLELQDRFGKPVKPREWFLVPLPAINEAVQRIRDGSIVNMVYHPATASLKPSDPA
jgi:T5orf172 domain